MTMPQRLAGISVLIVDDDADNCEILGISLTHLGVIVRTASSAEQALELFKASAPAIVLTDIAMQGRDGYWLLHEIRALPEGRSIPVIAVTGRATQRDRDALRAAGFDAHLVKPGDLDDMADLIATFALRC
jgi:CheY-like chemotaxis protein